MLTYNCVIPTRTCAAWKRWLQGSAGSLAAVAVAAALTMPLAAEARDASGKGSPVYGAGHDSPQPGRGISGKPEDHGKGGTSHVPGAKGGHDSGESHDDESHEGGKGGKGGVAGPKGGHDDEEHSSDGDDGTSHVPGPKGGHEDGEDHEDGDGPS